MNRTRLAEYFDVKADAVVGWRVVDGGASIRALIDYGIGGVKVFIVPADDLAEPEPAADLGYRELQALAKQHGIPANQSRDDLLAALSADDEEE